ncbi:MAG: hypothetical protein RL885_17290 [Planctomycetota bacterium]
MSKRLGSLIAFALLFAPAARAQIAKELVAPDLDGNSYYGLSVSYDQDRVLVGSRGWSDPGRVFLFEKAKGWEDPLVIQSSSPEPDGDGFGECVALSGDRMAVSARFEGEKGRIHVLTLDGGDWQEEAVLDGAAYLTGSEQHAFGVRLALQGTHLIATSLNQSDFFERIGGQWTHVLSVPDDLSIQSVQNCALDGDVAAIGRVLAPYGTNPNHFGVVDVYGWNGSSWKLTQRLAATDSPNVSNFGRGLDIDGDRIAVGARWALNGEGPQGAVYVFRRVSRGFILEQKLVPQTETEESFFGQAVALSGARLVAGAPWSELTGDYKPGAAHLFRFQSGQWSEASTLTDPNGYGVYDNFADEVDLSGSTMVIGASQDGPNSHGSVWVYEFPPPWRRVDRSFELVAEILVGVTAGGGGIIIVPGEGPVPIDPDPILPVLTMIQHSEASRKAAVAEIAQAAPREADIRMTADVRDALRYPDSLVILTTDRLGKDASWIAKNRDVLEQLRTQPVVMLGLESDRTVEALNALVAKGEWQ